MSNLTLPAAIPGRWFKGRRNRTAHYYKPDDNGLAICGTYAHSAAGRPGTAQQAEDAATAAQCQKCLAKLGL